MPWLQGEYEFTAPFSLKSTLATSSGGKTNIIPTMFSFKMALINASYIIGLDGKDTFSWIRDLKVYFRPPKYATVQNAFVKIMKMSRTERLKEHPDEIFSPTVALREYVIFKGPLTIAISTNELNSEQVSLLQKLMVHVNQLGKRGCFVQLTNIDQMNELGSGFTFYLSDETIQLSEGLLVHQLDDMGPEAKFEAVNNYDSKTAKISRDRLLVPVGIPYKLTRSSRTFTLYERVE